MKTEAPLSSLSFFFTNHTQDSARFIDIAEEKYKTMGDHRQEKKTKRKKQDSLGWIGT
jgi:hypothetical protein